MTGKLSNGLHQLCNGMYVGGPPPPPRPPPRTCPTPYIGGDVRKSGELGKMFNIPVAEPGAAAPSSASRPQSGTLPPPSPFSAPASRKTSGTQIPSTGIITSGPQPKSTPASGPASSRRSSGPQIPPTGLITSGPLGLSAPATPTAARKRKAYGEAVTATVGAERFEFGVSRAWGWVLVAVFAAGLGAGAFVWATVGRAEILVGVAAVMAVVVAVAAWNCARGRREVERFLRSRPDSPIDPHDLPHGKLVKITGHVTCGSIPLEASYQNIPRCVYVSTELHEYRGWNGFPANSKHKRFTWGLRSSERHAADFYISDPKTGMRFLVTAGNGAKVTSFVRPAIVLEMDKGNKQLTPTLLNWLAQHNLSSDGRIMRLSEGYIQEGHTASVMGILRRHGNLIMIDPPSAIISTGCQWTSCLFPLFVEGLIILGNERPDAAI